jgi:hypothetical protein
MQTFPPSTTVGRRLGRRLTAQGSPQTRAGWPTKESPAPGEAATPGQGTRH